MKPSACEKLVTAPEPFAEGNATVPCFAGDQRHQHEFLAAHLRRDPHRHARLDGLRGLRRQARAGADHRRDESMEGEDRRGRKARQHGDRLAVGDREAERLAGFQRHAMHENAGLAELRHDAMREIARALRRAARQHHHVAVGERAAHRLLQLGRVVGKCAERHRLAAGLGDGGGEDRAVGIIDAAGPQAFRRAGPARRRSRAPRPSAAAPRRSRPSPQAASMPISREPITWPLRSRVSPRAMSEPA